MSNAKLPAGAEATGKSDLELLREKVEDTKLNWVNCNWHLTNRGQYEMFDTFLKLIDELSNKKA